MKIYVHHNCNSCKKALKWLKEQSVSAEVINLLESTPTNDEFQIMTESYAGNLRKLFNTSGQLYRTMGIKDKVAEMTAEEVYALLGREGMLVKRPFLIHNSKGTVGFNEDTWAKFIQP